MLYKAFLKENNITITEAAKQLSVTRPHLTDIVNHRNGITPGRKLAYRMVQFAGGTVSLDELLDPDGICK